MEGGLTLICCNNREFGSEKNTIFKFYYELFDFNYYFHLQ